MSIIPAIVLLFLTNVLCAKSGLTNKFNNDNSDANLNINQLTEKYGYQCESHWVISEDGYVLIMHRIRNPDTTHESKPAVLIMHGITGSSIEWVAMGPNNSLAFDLVDAGYDVWLGNNRGNTFSRYHVRLDPDMDDDFWDFSFEDCGYYDLPAKIDYILKTTGQQKIFYVGLSQGTSQFFAMASLRPEYNDKIALMSAMGPVAFMAHTSSPVIKIAAMFMKPLEKLLKTLHWNEILSYNSLVSRISQAVCSNSALNELCVLPRFLIFGFDKPQLDKSTLNLQLSHSPAGTSVKSLIHYGQEVVSGEFRRFDYGSKALNQKHYKSDTPPNYNLSAITSPIALYYGQNDLLVSLKDVQRLISELPNVVKNNLIDYKRWNHLDFNWAKDVHKLVNLDVLTHQQEIIDNGGLTTTTTEPTNNGCYRIEQCISFSLITVSILLIFL